MDFFILQVNEYTPYTLANIILIFLIKKLLIT